MHRHINDLRTALPAGFVRTSGQRFGHFRALAHPTPQHAAVHVHAAV